ncbi:porin (plasmid) [Proteus mirabilis]|uniref:porin n=1 Tax=Enterobacterales TaxID=91347 RepID=UPI0015596F92|nr:MULTISPECIES: porin [Enterobacterales]USA34338.1 porin [Proteus mirabilis]USA38178.1 porin [Proteus mirabilis]WOR96205.1 porin [Proteus mirabilis]WOS03837.1 porin [Proteus mirabilis]WOS15089.1 porin [Proteus mirabilis]
MSVGCLNFVHADTSVTLYGVLDAGITHQRISGMWDGSPYSSKSTGLLSGGQSGNRWGLKVTESLGNGTAAVVQLESGFELTTGESKQGGRLFRVRLEKGNYPTIRASPNSQRRFLISGCSSMKGKG